MARLLLLVAIVVLVVWWVLGRTQRAMGRRDQRGRDTAALEMVACEHCGVHLPRSEARLDGEHVYCGEEHRRLGPRKP